jgi:hypothetical protein
VVRRALLVALALWIGRWAALELAGRLQQRLPPGPPPRDSPVQPGRRPARPTENE